MPDLWDQLGFLVIKILGGDFHSSFLLIKNKNSLSFSFSIQEDDCRDAVHVWHMNFY